MSKALYITWTEQDSEFDHWYYVGGGNVDPVFKAKTVKKQVRYSNDTSQEMIERAEKYIRSDMQDRQDAKVIIK